MCPPVVAAAAGRSSISPQIAVNRREIPDTGLGAGARKYPLFAGTMWPTPVPHVLLAMQKVEGSNPFSRFTPTRLYRASNGVVMAPSDVALGRGFRVD
jgi:hypothetical protein